MNLLPPQSIPSNNYPSWTDLLLLLLQLLTWTLSTSLISRVRMRIVWLDWPILIVRDIILDRPLRQKKGLGVLQCLNRWITDLMRYSPMIAINCNWSQLFTFCCFTFSFVNGRFSSLEFTPLLKPLVQESRKQIRSKSQDQKLPHHQLIVSKFPSPPKLQLALPSTMVVEQVYSTIIINFHNLLPLFCIISSVMRDLRNLWLLRKLLNNLLKKASWLKVWTALGLNWFCRDGALRGRCYSWTS